MVFGSCTYISSYLSEIDIILDNNAMNEGNSVECCILTGPHTSVEGMGHQDVSSEN